MEAVARLESELVVTKQNTERALGENVLLLCSASNRLRGLDKLLLLLTENPMPAATVGEMNDGDSESWLSSSQPTSNITLASSISSQNPERRYVTDDSPCHTFSSSDGGTDDDFADTTIALNSMRDSVQTGCIDSNASRSKPLIKAPPESSLSDNKRDLMKHITTRQENKIRFLLGGMKARMEREEVEAMAAQGEI